MIALARFLLSLAGALLKPKLWLEAENAALRHQLLVLRRRVRGRSRLTNGDRCFFVQMYRAGFRCYWRWKSRSLGGRPQIETELRALIRRMSIEKPLWGAPRIHGELLKLGFEVAQSSVAKILADRHVAKF
jgi:hypothetical protein